MVAVTVVVWTVAYLYFSLNSIVSGSPWGAMQYVLRAGRSEEHTSELQSH